MGFGVFLNLVLLYGTSERHAHLVLVFFNCSATLGFFNFISICILVVSLLLWFYNLTVNTRLEVFSIQSLSP